MTSDSLQFLAGLPSQTCEALAHALQRGALRYGFSPGMLQPFVGSKNATILHAAFQNLESEGFALPSLGTLCGILALAQKQREEDVRQILLTLSGPDVPGIPVFNTQSLVTSLFHEAEREVLVTSYVLHDAGEVLEPLALKHDQNPDFKVRFVLDLTHRRTDARSDFATLQNEFLREFRKHHWRGERLPEIWDDPRNFTAAGSGVMHAKTVVVDRKSAFLSSANFTEAALSRNIEAGVLVRQPRLAERLTQYFDGLMNHNILRRIH
jgi:phosphatidylserine/phosphatidylglycerophosphate/cardiolipin synthase-like enzyme